MLPDPNLLKVILLYLMGLYLVPMIWISAYYLLLLFSGFLCIRNWMEGHSLRMTLIFFFVLLMGLLAAFLFIHGISDLSSKNYFELSLSLLIGSFLAPFFAAFGFFAVTVCWVGIVIFKGGVAYLSDRKEGVSMSKDDSRWA